MFYRTQVMTFPWALAAALVQTLGTRPAAALLTTPTLRLFSDAALTITPDTPVGSFTEATFGGYAAVTLAALIGPVLNPPNGALMHQEGDFAADSTIGAGQVCYGYVVTDAGKTVWYGAENFVNPITRAPAPMNFSAPGNFASVDVAWSVQDLLQLFL